MSARWSGPSGTRAPRYCSTPPPTASTSRRCGPACRPAATTSTSAGSTERRCASWSSRTSSSGQAAGRARNRIESRQDQPDGGRGGASARRRGHRIGSHRRDPRVRRGPRPGGPGRRPASPALRDPDPGRRVDARAGRAAGRPPRADRAARSRGDRRLRRTDRTWRDDLHAALRAGHVRRQLRLPERELPAFARAGSARAPEGAGRRIARGGGQGGARGSLSLQPDGIGASGASGRRARATR